MATGTENSLTQQAVNILKILSKKTDGFVPPAIDQIIAEFGRDPFLILISCLLSLRTRDATSVAVSKQLFKKAKTPQELLAIPTQELEKIIHCKYIF